MLVVQKYLVDFSIGTKKTTTIDLTSHGPPFYDLSTLRKEAQTNNTIGISMGIPFRGQKGRRKKAALSFVHTRAGCTKYYMWRVSI
jgi:hypothetical protein